MKQIERTKKQLKRPKNSIPTTDTGQDKKIDSGRKSGQSEGGKWTSKWSSIEEMEKSIPKQYRNLYRKAIQGKSRKAAIRLECLMCTGYKMCEVRKCTGIACHNYPYRMGEIQK
jgi:hypothetical protein